MLSNLNDFVYKSPCLNIIIFESLFENVTNIRIIRSNKYSDDYWH